MAVQLNACTRLVQRAHIAAVCQHQALDLLSLEFLHPLPDFRCPVQTTPLPPVGSRQLSQLPLARHAHHPHPQQQPTQNNNPKICSSKLLSNTIPIPSMRSRLTSITLLAWHLGHRPAPHHDCRACAGLRRPHPHTPQPPITSTNSSVRGPTLLLVPGPNPMAATAAPAVST